MDANACAQYVDAIQCLRDMRCAICLWNDDSHARIVESDWQCLEHKLAAKQCDALALANHLHNATDWIPIMLCIVIISLLWFAYFIACAKDQKKCCFHTNSDKTLGGLSDAITDL